MRDLRRLPEIAQRERAEVAGVAGQPADRVIAEGLGPRAADGARGEPRQRVASESAMTASSKLWADAWRAVGRSPTRSAATVI